MKLSENAQKLLEERYCQSEENCWEDICKRVSNAISLVEKTDEDMEKWCDIFFDIMNNMDFIPSTPCLTNAGTKSQQLSSCFIIDVKDNLDSIYEAKLKAAKIFQKNGGVGFNISALRPNKAPLISSQGASCGCIGFMEEFNLTADVVTRNNMRKGAIKIDLNDWHPDIIDFISCKDNTNSLTKMNISVSLSNKFMQAVKEDAMWDLVFPDYKIVDKNIYDQVWDGDLEKWEKAKLPVNKYKTMRARELYRMIMEHAWKSGEPGVSFRDLMNCKNPNPHMGTVNSTNPCSEFCSIPYNSCNLGSINLTHFVTKDKKLDEKKIRNTVNIAVRFLDNMITANSLPLPEIDSVTKSLRSIGLGTMGLADMLYLLEIPYNSNKAETFIHKLYSIIWDSAVNASKDLAQEKGVYSVWEQSNWWRKNIKIRNSNLISIAPNGSISFIANTSGGLEPNFALVYTRRTNEGVQYHVVNPIFKEKLIELGLYSDELIDKIAHNKGSCQGIAEIPKDIQSVFVVAGDILPEDHVKVVGIIQEYTDLAASKTVNLPNKATVDDVMGIYMQAWELGIKGITIYRDGSRENQTLSTKSTVKDDKNRYTISVTDLNRGDIICCTDDLIGKKRKLTTGCGHIHCQAWFDPDTGELMETFFPKGSGGGCRCNEDAVSRMVSLAARGGICVESIVDQLMSCGGCDSYRARTMTKHDTSKGSSCPTAIAHAILNMHSEVIKEISTDETTISNEEYRQNTESSSIVALCPECGEGLYFEGGCNICKACGWSKCS